MKRTITVIGAGYIEGKKKTGESYRFFEINGTYADPQIEGLRVANYKIFNQQVLDDAIVRPGEQLNVWSHFFNGSEFVDAILNV